MTPQGKLSKLVVIFLGMTGLRLDLRSRHVSFVIWVALFIAGGLAYLFLTPISKTAACVYAALVWLLYYVGNAVVLCTPIRTWLIQRYGETRALRYYNTVLGLVFVQQGFSQGAFLSAFQGSLYDETGALRVLGLILIAGGVTVKTWATYTSGLDIYYYNDMFLGRATRKVQTAIVSGPYKYFKNPMYGVGNAQAYGSALIAGTWQGLALCAFFNFSIYLFYWYFEKPFTIRTYFSQAEPALSI